jgi:hypothetical protein
MSPEKQRMAIAAVCGWTELRISEKYQIPSGLRPNFQVQVLNEVPNYTKDLNAMHEAERIGLNSSELLSDYADILDKVCVPTHICCLTHWQSVVMATAAQRAEAFLKALGLWDPPTPKQEAGK